jgi:hypothetical protein
VSRLVLVVAVAVLAGCGGSNTTTSSTTTAAVPDPAAAMRALVASHPELAGAVRTLYQGSSWAVVQSTAGGKAHAVVFQLVGGKWLPDLNGRVKVKILGPQPGARVAGVPQVAIEVNSKLPFVETALWIDGTELLEKGGGSPTEGTIYGSPEKALKPGPHVAVGFARTIADGTAVAWVFKAT